MRREKRQTHVLEKIVTDSRRIRRFIFARRKDDVKHFHDAE